MPNFMAFFTLQMFVLDQYFLKSTAVQMRGVLPNKWEAHCSTNGRCTVRFAFLKARLRSQEGPGTQMGGGVLPYELGVYCRTFFETSRGWDF